MNSNGLKHLGCHATMERDSRIKLKDWAVKNHAKEDYSNSRFYAPKITDSMSKAEKRQARKDAKLHKEQRNQESRWFRESIMKGE